MLKANVSPIGQEEISKTYVLEKQKGEMLLDQELLKWDCLRVKEGSFHILKDHKSYWVELIDYDSDSKTFTLKINQAQYRVALQDRFDLLINQLGMKAGSNKVSEIKAPMPGLILEIVAQEGQEVIKGDTLLILEAMKMENVIKSPVDGTVKSIKIGTGDNVEKNQILLNFK